MKFTFGLGLVGLAALSSAQIYNNGAPNELTGNEMSAFQVADSFTLGSPASVDSVQYWDVEGGSAPND